MISVGMEWATPPALWHCGVALLVRRGVWHEFFGRSFRNRLRGGFIGELFRRSLAQGCPCRGLLTWIAWCLRGFSLAMPNKDNGWLLP